MKKTFVVTAALLVLGSTFASAQRASSPAVEVRPFAAAWVPMGAMREDFRDATTIGGQGAIELSDNWHMVGTVGWTYGKNRFAAIAKERTYIIHYDVGAEANLLYELANSWLVKPFGGLGVGARSYDYGVAAIGTMTCTSGYGGIGTELQRSVIALRVEARQYASCFESPVTGTKKTRTDGLYAIGFAYHIR